MATINLKIEPIAGTSTQVSDNDYMLEFNENIEAGRVIGVLTGFLSTADRNNANFEALNEGDGGRFEIVKATSAGPGYNVGDWIVRIKSGGENYFNYENNGGFDNLFRYTSVGTNTYNVSIDVLLEDINDAPKNISVTGGSVEGGKAGVNVGTLSALDEDDIFWHESGLTQVTYSIDSGLNGNLFEIQGGVLKLRNGASLDYANAPKFDGNGRYYEVIVRASDGGGYDSDTGAQLPGTARSSTETIKVYVTPSTNTAPNLGGVTTTVQAVADTGTVDPFRNVTITDDGTVTVRITLDNNAEGVFTAASLTASGFRLDNGVYVLSNVTASTAQTAIRQLVFDPQDRPNATVGAGQSTTFTIEVNDGVNPAVTNNVTTVNATAANRAPTLNAPAVTHTIAETETVAAFSAVTIADTNAGDTVTVTIILDDRNKGAFTDAQALGFTVNAQGHYVLTGVSAAIAQDRIRQLTFDPRDRQGQTGTETTSFTITVRDANGGQATASTNQINVVSTHTYVNQAPSISVAPGKETTNATYEGGSVRPFTGVDIGDLENDSLTLEISFAEVDGRLENTDGVNGEIRDGTITYTFSNRSADALDQLIRNIWFNPANKPGTNSFTTSFTIKVDDPSHDPVENRQVKVITSTTNATPSITVPVGKETTVATDDGLNVNPFKDVAIADQDGDRISLQIAFDADDGRLEETDGVQGVVEAGTITYTFTNYTLDAIRLLMSQLEFDPTNRNDTPGTIYQTQFKISVKDAVHDYVSNSQIRVVTTITEKDPTNDAPTVRVAAGQISHVATDVGQTAKPFTGVILDDDEDDELTVTISFAAADGALEKYGDAEWSVQNGVITYEFSGKAGDIEAQLDLVEFNPRDRPDTLTSSTHKTSFTIKVNDQAHASSTPATNNSIEVITNITPKNTGPSRITLSGDSVAELAADNFKVGTFGAVDANPGDTFTYSMVPGSDADGRFKIVNVGGTWELHVVSGVRLDNEQASSHNIKVMVVDRSGASFIQDFTIKVNDLNPETMTAASASSLNDIIKGSKAGNFKDVFYGGAGDDKLWGGYGNDILSGGVGKDVFVFDGKLGSSKTDRQVNFDTIMDYSVKEDSIWLEGDLFKSNKKLFAAIKKGTENKPFKMASKFFTVGDKAKDADDYFVYDAKKRVLYYDADGSGSKAAIEMASFTNNKALKNFKHTEFFFI